VASKIIQDGKPDMAKDCLSLPVVSSLFSSKLVKFVTIPRRPIAAVGNVFNCAGALASVMSIRLATLAIDFCCHFVLSFRDGGAADGLFSFVHCDY